MMESSLPPLMLTAAGFLLVALGIVLVIWPAVLPWLVATMAISVGVGMFMMAQMFRSFTTSRRAERG